MVLDGQHTFDCVDAAPFCQIIPKRELARRPRLVPYPSNQSSLNQINKKCSKESALLKIMYTFTLSNMGQKFNQIKTNNLKYMNNQSWCMPNIKN